MGQPRANFEALVKFWSALAKVVFGEERGQRWPVTSLKFTWRKPMNAKSFLIASAIVVGLGMPATAQQSTTMHRYAAFYKYTDQMIKELIDHPQERDRGAAISKLFETYGVKIEAGYIFPMGGEFDGLLIVQAPNDTAIEAIQLVTRSGGTAVRSVVVPVITSGEFRTLMETAKQGAASYAPPGR
jgi:uncharacterized protein with GYD domain